MTTKTKTTTTKGTNGTPTIAGKAAAQAKLEKLQEAAKIKRETAKLTKWETEKKAANPQYVVGSVRIPTAEDFRTFAKRGVKCHGRVGEIVCLECSETVVRNTQDLHQSRFCDDHKKKASYKRAASRRKTKKDAGRTIGVINAEIAALTAELGEDIAKVS